MQANNPQEVMPAAVDVDLSRPRSRPRRLTGMERFKSWLSSSGWYLIMIVFALITALPFLWTALMSVRPTSANIFQTGRPPQIIPYPGMIGWGDGLSTARREGEYIVLPNSEEAREGRPVGVWRNFEPAMRERIEGTALEPLAFPATTANYHRVWTDVELPRYFLNSIIVAAGVVFLQLLTSSLAAYPLAKMQFAGRDILFYVILSTLIFPEQLTLIPVYIMAVNYLGFVDTLHGLIIPFGANAFGIFLLRQTYQSIPNELIEAARIDGASEFGIWWRILLPLIRPGLATLAIFSFVGSWNNFLWPLLMLRDTSLYTLPVGLAFLEGAFTGNLRTVAAGIVIATVPIIIVFLMFQRHFIKGLAGAVKG
ncbi:MAG: carbohydrate ABC transporter permease [Anaerolineaceae bacterium]|nr:MAG: carbohydrate ABC transporter permease [Anaerolineaceae bacterium]